MPSFLFLVRVKTPLYRHSAGVNLKILIYFALYTILYTGYSPGWTGREYKLCRIIGIYKK